MKEIENYPSLFNPSASHKSVLGRESALRTTSSCTEVYTQETISRLNTLLIQLLSFTLPTRD